ncbi:hypothetical protein [Hoeflea sp.]|uniref:hypothetical protein n=1 Tax=Hoeflea sp. TaxID=1940281 RepID=UPI003749F0AD
MSIRDRYGHAAPWLAVLAFCAIAGTAYWTYTYSKGAQSVREYYQPERAAYDAQQQAYIKCLDKPSIQEARECYQGSSKPTREQTRAEQDLDAQREMADWAERMLIITAVVGFSTVIITAFGVYWVRKTLDATYDAVNAARDTNAIAKQVGFAQNRPWMSLEYRLHEPPRIDGEFFVFSVWIQPKNVGNAPALDFFLTFEQSENLTDAYTTKRNLDISVQTLNRMPLVGEPVFPGQERSRQLRNVKLKIGTDGLVRVQMFMVARYKGPGFDGFLNTAEPVTLKIVTKGPAKDEIDTADIAGKQFILQRKLCGYAT